MEYIALVENKCMRTKCDCYDKYAVRFSGEILVNGNSKYLYGFDVALGDIRDLSITFNISELDEDKFRWISSAVTPIPDSQHGHTIQDWDEAPSDQEEFRFLSKDEVLRLASYR